VTLTAPSRQLRPAPDWDLVYKRNFIERLKRDRPGLAVRDELPELIERGYEEISEEEIVRLYWWGLAHDKPKIGTFMVRIKVPAGRVTPAQLRALGDISAAFGRGEAELTTRQGIQLHWVPMAQLPDVMAAIEAAGLTTAGAEGDTVRNITSCPVAGLQDGELFDVWPIVKEAAAFFSGNPEYSNLPRKLKYTISACPAQCNGPDFHDVALVATEQDGELGFGLRVGGGMSNTPRLSRDLGVFVPRDDAIAVLRAVTDAWQRDLRYRLSRAKARIKFMVDDYGPEGMRAKVEEVLGRRLPDGRAPEPVGEADHLGVHPQRNPELVYVGVPVPSGRITAHHLHAIADLADQLGGDVRFTRQQNFILGNVPRDRLDDVRDALAAMDFPLDRSRAYGRSVACTSHKFCNYSVAETKGKLDAILDHLAATFGAQEIDGLTIHMDGCPHACAQHWIGEIGLQGTSTSVEGSDERIEAYDVTIGGGLGRRAAIGRRLLRRVPTTEIEHVLARLVGAWLEERRRRGAADFTFGDFTATRTDEELQRIAGGERESESATSVVVTVPGPLLAMIGGADRYEVSARTVREALEAVSRRHPAFGAAVLPNGDVAEAYLVTVGDDDIRTLDGLDTPVAPGTEISLVMAMSGG